MAPHTNGNTPVTRYELNLNLQPLKDDIHEIREDVGEIRLALGAGPKWLGARANAIVDKILPSLIAVAALWVLSGRLG
jgi:hypothetical protein